MDKRTVQSEKAILEAGINTLLENRMAGMSEIAQAAGIGRATLYRHFKTREALVKRLALDCYEEFDKAYAHYDHLAGRAAIEKVFEIATQMAQRFNFLIKRWSSLEDDDDLRRVDAQSHNELSYLFDQAKRAGDIDKNLPNAWLLVFFDHLLAAGCELMKNGDVTAIQASEFMSRCFFKGCGTNGVTINHSEP